MNLSKRYHLFCLFSRLLNKNAITKYDFCRKCYFSTNTKYKIYEELKCHSKPLLNFCYFLSTNSDNKCWKCGSSVLSLFCNKCSSLQRVNKDKNYFELLGVDINYELKLPELTRKYRELQAVLHPDKFGNKSEEEKVISEEYSSVINKAYSTLSHPIDRGLYMLKLQGTFIEEGSVQLDSSFLMDIMERNEEIEGEKDERKLFEYNKINKDSMKILMRELVAAFQKDDITTAKEILAKLKYYSSIDSKIKAIKQNLGIPD